MEFQIGDRVKVIHDDRWNRYYEGKEGKVTYLTGYGTPWVAVSFDNRSTMPFHENELRKIN